MERRLFGQKYVCDVSRWPQQAIFLIGERYIPEARLIQQLLKRGMRIVDVGANVGYYMLMFAEKVGTEGHIIAIEPSPENLPEL
jgi:ubiquinone/menaquinone biosynthesis C-methylase UbiE